MFGALMLVLGVGMPLSFGSGALTILFMYLVGDKYMLNIIPTRVFPMMTNYQLSAIPLFIFMAAMLERAGLIDDMFTVVYKWLGGLRGGLASATIVASTILAAMVGIVGAAVVTNGHDRAAGHAEPEVRSEDRPGIGLGRWNAGHSDPAVDPGHRLRRRGAGIGR